VGSMTSLGTMAERVGRGGAIAGALATIVAAAALAFFLAGRGSDAAARSGLTVNLPPAANDRIYAAAIAV
jgi:predicted amino acid dehydrogenase